MKNLKNYSLFFFLCFFIFNLSVSAKTISEEQKYSDPCFTQFQDPFYFQNAENLNDTPFYIITETIPTSDNTKINYSLYAFNTNDIYFDLTGGTFYQHVKNNTQIFTTALWTCSTTRSNENTEIFTADNSITWTNKWITNRDFSNKQWNRSLFRKWDNNEYTSFTYEQLLGGFNYQLLNSTGTNYGYIVSSNFDLYNSDNVIVFEKSLKTLEPAPVPPTAEEEINNKLEDINNAITDTTLPKNDYDTMAGWLPAGPVDSLLNIPLIFLNQMNTSAGEQCQPLKLKWLNNTDIDVPCIMDTLLTTDFKDIISVIDSVLALFLSAGACVSFYKYIDKKSKLQDNNDLGGVM